MRYTGKDSESIGVPTRYFEGSNGALRTLSGVYLGKVVDIKDDTYQSHIYVELVGHQVLSNKDSDQARKEYHKVRRVMSFGGAIQTTDYSNNYGMMAHPPTPGTEVLVAFTGREQEGYLLGVLPDSGRNAQIPGIPAGELKQEGETTIGPATDLDVFSKDAVEKFRHPQANQLAKQGLGYDSIRGLTSSGGRRESPINLFGFNTPGGHSFVMDDGTRNDKHVIVPDKDRAQGDNNCMRWRSKNGAQILFHDTAGIVYIINQSGTAWVQLSDNGDIDVFGEGKISMHSEDDFNLHVGGCFNLEAECINIKATGSDGVKLETTTGGIDVHSNKDLKLTSDKNGHIKTDGFIRLTSKLIDLNGPEASTATKTTPNNLTTNLTIKKSTASRVPEHEPWGGHAEEQVKVASQAPGKLTSNSKDYDLEKLQSNVGSGSSSNQLPNYQQGFQTAPNQTPGYQQGVAYDNMYAQNIGVGSVQKTDTKDVNPRTGLGWKKGPR